MNDRTWSILVQNAETVRFRTFKDGGKAVTKLQAGDRLLMRRDNFARHIGMPILESLTEA
jgi:3-dehydroquinate synthase class II